MKTLLSFEVYKMTGKQICENIRQYLTPGFLQNRKVCLPDYVILSDGKLGDSRDHFQFYTDVDFISEEELTKEWIFISGIGGEPTMAEERDLVGECELWENYICGSEDALKKIKSTFIINEYDFKTIPTPTNYIIKITGTQSWTDCGYEYDTEYDLLGYLDRDYIYHSFEDEK